MHLIVYKSEVSSFMAYDSSYMSRVQKRWEEWLESAMVSWLKSHRIEVKILRHQNTETNSYLHAARVTIDGAELTEFMLRFGDQI